MRPFTFAIPLIPRASARDWGVVDRLLELTLTSVLKQTDQAFRVLLAGHEEPDCWNALVGGDPRFRFLRASWPAPSKPTPANDDGGCKKWMMKEWVRKNGAGLLMYLDADDLVDRRLVATARALIGAADAGGVIEDGFAIDLASLRALRLPDPLVFDGGFHRVCGSSTIGNMDAAALEHVGKDPFQKLGSHHNWPEAAARVGVRLQRLPLCGGYVVNTSENHSERHGPFADWRRSFNRAVATQGSRIDRPTAALFGLDPARLHI